MDIRAILLVGGHSTRKKPSRRNVSASIPLACLDVLGHVGGGACRANACSTSGSRICSLIADSPSEANRFAAMRCSRCATYMRLHATGEQLWQAAEEAFQRCAEDGAELVIVLRMGPYVEVDYEEMIQHHLDRRSCRDPGRGCRGEVGSGFVRAKRLGPHGCSGVVSQPVAAAAPGVRAVSRHGLRQPSAAARRPAPTGPRRPSGDECGSSARQGSEAGRLGRDRRRASIARRGSWLRPLSAPTPRFAHRH